MAAAPVENSVARAPIADPAPAASSTARRVAVESVRRSLLMSVIVGHCGRGVEKSSNRTLQKFPLTVLYLLIMADMAPNVRLGSGTYGTARRGHVAVVRPFALADIYFYLVKN